MKFSTKKSMTFLVSMFLVVWTTAQLPNVVINELNADNPGTGGPGGGTDNAEFLELFGDPNTPLDSLVLVFFNGGQAGISYAAYDLDGYTLDPFGFFTIGASTVNGVDYVFPNPSNNIQNGADAIAIYRADAADFPTGTLPATTDLVDAIVYGTNDAQDNNLIALLGLDLLVPGYTQLDETAQTTGTDLTLSRIPDGGAPYSLQYVLQALTPDTYNQPPCVSSGVLLADNSTAAEFCDNQPAVVSWFAFAGSGNYLTAVVDAGGLIVATTQDTSFDFTAMVGSYMIYHVAYTETILNNTADIGMPFSGIVTDECLDVASSASVVIQLCSGCVGGSITANGNSSLVVISDENADFVSFANSSTSVTANYAYVLTDENNGVIQLVDASFDFNSLSSGWYKIWGISYSNEMTLPASGNDIYGAVSDVCLEFASNQISLHVVVIPYVVINELNADNPSGGGGGGGQDAAEFIELYGEANSSLDGLSLVFYNGTGAVSYGAYDLDGQSLNEFGFFVLGSTLVAEADMTFNNATNNIQNGADAVALVIGDASDYPNNTPINGEHLVDAMVYGTNDAQDNVLIAGLGLDTLIIGYFQQDETAQTAGTDLTLSRIPDGGNAFDTTYVVQALTPGTWNLPPCIVTNPTLTDSNTSLTLCEGGPITFELAPFTGTGNHLFVVTNASDLIIDWSTNNLWDITGQTGELHIYTVAYTGDLDLASLIADGPVSNITASECFAISDSFITINIVPCVGCIGGSITANSNTSATVVLNGTPVFLTLENTSTSISALYTYILVDANNAFLMMINDGFDYSTLTSGTYGIIGLSYEGEISGNTIGNPYTDITAADCAEFSSNIISLYVVQINPVVINEMNADNPGGPDTSEFVELYGPANASLDNLVIVLFDGTAGTSYDVFDLDGYTTDENGFFVLGNAATTNVDYIIADASIQNGSDAIAIYAGNAEDFPNGSVPSDLNLVDALVYATGDQQIDALITGLGLDVLVPGYAQFDETAQQTGIDLTQSRVPDGGSPFDNSSFVLQPLTPGTFNIVESGCIDQNACNYSSTALVDDGSCYFIGDPCDDGNAETVDDMYDANCGCAGSAPLLGCMDVTACNYNAEATTDDGSCYFTGDACDDSDPNTTNDMYDINCLCAGIVGVEENTLDVTFTAYPNPVKDQLNMNISVSSAGVYSFQLIDITGKIVANQSLLINHMTSISVDTSEISAGVYTAKWSNGQNADHILIVKE